MSVGKRAIDLSYEVKSCMKSQPQCIRERDACLGSCNGDTSTLTQDFATIAVKQELSVAALGSDVLALHLSGLVSLPGALTAHRSG